MVTTSAQWYAERVRLIDKIGDKNAEKKNLLLIIPFFNEVDLVFKNLDYLKMQTFKEFDVALCYSIEGEKFFNPEELKKELQKRKYPFTIYLIKTEFDNGIPTGFFAGEVFAIKHNYEAVMYVDVDAFAVNKDLVKIVWNEYKKENVAIVPYFVRFLKDSKEIKVIQKKLYNTHNFTLVPISILKEVGLHYVVIPAADDLNFMKRLIKTNKIKYLDNHNLLSIHPFKIENEFVVFSPLTSMLDGFLWIDHSFFEMLIKALFVSFLCSVWLLFTNNSMTPSAFLYDLKKLIKRISSNEIINVQKERKEVIQYFRNYKTTDGSGVKEIEIYSSIKTKNWSLESKKWIRFHLFSFIEKLKYFKFFRKIIVQEWLDTKSEFLLFHMFSKQYWIKDGDRYILLADNSNPFIHALKLMLLPLIYPFFLALFALVTIIGLIKHVNTTGYGTDIDYSKVNC